MIFRDRRSGLVYSWTLTVDPGYHYFEIFAGVISWYTMTTSDFISSICFTLKIENNELVLFNEQSITLRLSDKDF